MQKPLEDPKLWISLNLAITIFLNGPGSKTKSVRWNLCEGLLYLKLWMMNRHSGFPVDFFDLWHQIHVYMYECSLTELLMWIWWTGVVFLLYSRIFLESFVFSIISCELAVLVELEGVTIVGVAGEGGRGAESGGSVTEEEEEGPELTSCRGGILCWGGSTTQFSWFNYRIRSIADNYHSRPTI